MTKDQIKNSIYFISEQARCLIQAQGTEYAEVEICEQAVRYLAKDDPALLQTFKERTDGVQHDPGADYDTEQYEGKEADTRRAIIDFIAIAKEPGTPADQAEILTQLAQMIAEFYGMEDALPEVV
ncbi:MAG: hypothetical protein FWE20_08780 [Defluviitaleaceae bacterium]|nr:hypothetical protein [Defluviitaleaceae bacterium]